MALRTLSSAEVSFVLLGRVGSLEAGERGKVSPIHLPHP